MILWKNKNFQKNPKFIMDIMWKILNYVQNLTIKAENLSDAQDVPKKQITENILVSSRILAFIE